MAKTGMLDNWFVREVLPHEAALLRYLARVWPDSSEIQDIRHDAYVRILEGGLRPVAEVEQLLTWRTGYLVFDRTPLAEAVAEFNRYNRRKLVILDPQVAAIRIGGNFRTTNVDAFLRLVECDFPVVISEQGGQIVLAAATEQK